MRVWLCYCQIYFKHWASCSGNHWKTIIALALLSSILETVNSNRLVRVPMYAENKIKSISRITMLTAIPYPLFYCLALRKSGISTSYLLSNENTHALNRVSWSNQLFVVHDSRKINVTLFFRFIWEGHHAKQLLQFNPLC